MTLQELYSLVSYISGRFPQGGALPPARFNTLLSQVNAEYYDKCWKELVASSVNDELYSKVSSTTPLIPFKKTATLTADATGLAALPGDYADYLVAYTAEGRKIDIVSDDLLVRQRRNVFARSDIKPSAKITADGLTVIPLDTGIVTLDYLSAPAVPYMDTAQDCLNPSLIRFLDVGNSIELVNGTVTPNQYQVYLDEYSSDNGDDPLYLNVYYTPGTGLTAPYRSRTVELGWMERDHYKFVSMILSKVGVNLAEMEVVKYAEMMPK